MLPLSNDVQQAFDFNVAIVVFAIAEHTMNVCWFVGGGVEASNVPDCTYCHSACFNPSEAGLLDMFAL